MQEKITNENLSRRVIKGGFWVFLLRIVRQFLSFGKLIILARILSPDDFGLLGIALLTIATLGTFSSTGFQQALIQRKEDISSYLDSTWTFLIFRGFFLFVTLYFIAPYVAVFFDAAGAKEIIRVTGFSVLIQPFTNIGIIYFQKELEFNKQFIYQLSGTLVDFIVSVLAVLILKNVWSLVFGLLAGNMTRCFISYLIHSYRPRLAINFSKVKELFGFGKWVLGASILIFLITQGDDIFVGKLLGITALGFYQMAYRISNMPATEITQVISQVTYPAYSKLQDDIPRLREAYLKVLQLTTFFSFPIAGSIFILGSDFTGLLLGGKWLPMIPAMQVLTWWGAVRSMAGVNSSILQSVKRPDIITKLSAIKLPILAALLYPLAVKWGIIGVSIAVLTSALIITPNTFYIVASRILKSKMSIIFRTISVPLSGTIFMVLFLNFFNPGFLSISGLVLRITSGFIVYFVITYVIDKLSNQQMWYNIGNLVLTTIDKQ